MEPQKTPNSQNNLEKEQQSWRCYTPFIPSKLQRKNKKLLNDN